MHRRFQLVVCDALEDVAEVDNHLIVDGLNTPVLSIDEHLQAWISKRREERNEAAVRVLGCRQLQRLLVKLAAVDLARIARQQVHRAQRRHGILLEPVSEEVAVLLESEGNELAKFKGQLVHLVVVLVEKLLDPLVLLLRWEWGLLVER